MTTSSPLLRDRPRRRIAPTLAACLVAVAMALGGATSAVAGEAEAHGAGHGSDHGGGDHGAVVHPAKKHEEKPRINIASIFDLFKAWAKDTYDAKHHLTDAKAEVAALSARLDAAREARDRDQVRDLEHELAAAMAHLDHYKREYAAASPTSRALVWIYKHSYGIIAVIIVVLWFLLARRLGAAAALKPARWGTCGELFVRGLYGLYEPVLGKDEIRRYFPFLASLFCFILFNNLMSVVPFSKSPSAVFFNNFGLGIAVFFYVQYIGITRCGPKDYVLHFLGNPQGFIGWFLGIFLLLPLEILAELVRPISLSLRLFGNIMGEDILLLVFCTIGLQLTAGMLGPVGEYAPLGIPLHFALYPIILLGSALQALVFTILTAVYISLKLPHGHHDEDHAHDEGGHAHAHAH